MADASITKTTICQGCGAIGLSPAAFHPWAACMLMQATRSTDQVEANIRFVVEYGMRAQEQGVSLDDAMNNIALVR